MAITEKLTRHRTGQLGEAFALTLPGVTKSSGTKFDCMRDDHPVEVKTTVGRGWSQNDSDSIDDLVAADGWWLFVWLHSTGEVKDHRWVRAADHPRQPPRRLEYVYFPKGSDDG